MSEKVYPYFANQQHLLSHGNYAGEEYDHRFKGVIQYYNEELQLSNSILAIRFIKSILEKSVPGRNDQCICGSGIKTKKCHLASIQTLIELGDKVLHQDLMNFEQWELAKTVIN